jgi:hypothetical protein
MVLPHSQHVLLVLGTLNKRPSRYRPFLNTVSDGSICCAETAEQGCAEVSEE